MEKLLQDKVAVITGAGAGIGKAIAVAFAREGCDIAVCDVMEETAQQTVLEIEALGRKAAAYIVDVTDSDAVKETMDKIIDNFNQINILVNNAGITRDGLLVRMSDSDWQMVLNVNLNGTFIFSRAASRYMMKQRSGSIVSIASIIGLIGNAGQANYSASKAGVIGLTKSLAKELASRGVRANAIAPGFIKTAMTDKLNESQVETMLSNIPMKSLGTPEDVARAALFLASDQSAYITGQVLVVDGGMVM
jgi:3-oxoacyl-[acyl-carrier protein] reductase